MEKVILTAALTGAVTPKSANPNIPMTPKEIAEDAYRCWQEGASIVHLHMRDENFEGTMNKELFKETIELITSKCDIVINVTSAGAKVASDEERIAHIIELKPEMASFDAGTLNWTSAGVVAYNTPPFLEKLGKATLENNVKPELEIFDAGMISNTEYYLQKGLLAPPLYYQFVLGVLGGIKATVDNLCFLKSQIPEGAVWSAFGIGQSHLPIMYAALALGGNVRVGLEDNVYYAKGQLATNPQLVARAVRVINEFNKGVATPDDARKILGLKNKRQLRQGENKG